MSLKLKKWNPAKIPDSCVIVIVAKRNSGKSYLLRDILYHKRHALKSGIVFSPTEEGTGFFGKFIPGLFIYSEFDRDAIQRLIDRQKKLSKQGKADPVFLVLDDMAYDKKVFNDKIMRNLVFNGRHYKINLLICSQYLIDMPPSLRSNVDYLITLRDNTNREKLHKHMFSIFRTFDQFNAVMDVVTENYGCLVLDNISHSNNIEECVFHYKAKPDLQFKMGHPSFWGFARQHYDERYDERDETPKKAAGICIKKLK